MLSFIDIFNIFVCQIHVIVVLNFYVIFLLNIHSGIHFLVSEMIVHYIFIASVICLVTEFQNGYHDMESSTLSAQF
jgi:hypothetical protein